MLEVSDFKIASVVKTVSEKDFIFLNLSGRKYYHKQNYKGKDVIVAVVDTGVNPHPEFEDRLLPGFCTHPNYSSKHTEDDRGHGTHVAGTIAGAMCGIAPQAKILPVKALDWFGTGDIENLVRALELLIVWRGPKGEVVDIVNLSVSCKEASLKAVPGLYERFELAVKELTKMGVTLIAAAGNSGIEENLYPAAFYDVTCVGAVDFERKEAYFTTKGNHVDVCQIGVDVLSAHYMGHGYMKASGTSMATPMVSGIAALITSKYKALLKRPLHDSVRYEMLKLLTVDVGLAGVDKATGVGFCTLSPAPMVLELVRDREYMLQDGSRIPLRQPCVVMNGRTLAPIREPYEAFGATVAFDESVYPSRALIQI